MNVPSNMHSEKPIKTLLIVGSVLHSWDAVNVYLHELVSVLSESMFAQVLFELCTVFCIPSI